MAVLRRLWWQPGSVHRAPWPDAHELRSAADGVDQAVLEIAADLLAEVRKAKTSEKKSLRTEVARLTVEDDTD